MIKSDVLGFTFNTSEPAFTITGSGTYYFHLLTKKLYDVVSFNNFLTEEGKGFTQYELGEPSPDLIDLHGGMLTSTLEQIIPTAPSDGAAVADGPTSMLLTWIDNADGEAGYSIRRSLSGEAIYPEIVALPPGTEEYVDTGLEPETAYVYRVFAMNSGGYSAATQFSGTTEAEVVEDEEEEEEEEEEIIEDESEEE